MSILPSVTDTGKILDQAVTDGMEDTPANRAIIQVFWNAWPGVAQSVGAYDPKTMGVFMKALQAATGVVVLGNGPANTIANAIYELGVNGTLDQKYLDPQHYAATQALNTQAVAATGGSLLDKLMSPVTAVENNWTWIKWSAVGVGVIALLWVARPYLKAGTTGIKAISEKFKRKENPEPETDEMEEVEE
jgi:hypothetical protein